MAEFERLADREGLFLAACSSGDVSVVVEMLDGGVDIELTDKSVSQQTGLLRAAAHGRENVTRLLLCRGANAASVSIDGRNALHNACAEGHEMVATHLLDSPGGASLLDSRDNRGRTPCHLASARGFLGVVVMLILRGCDVEVCDYSGRGLVQHLGTITRLSQRQHQAAIKTIQQARLAHLRDAEWRLGIRNALPGTRTVALASQVQAQTQTQTQTQTELSPSRAYRQQLRDKRPKGWTVGTSRWRVKPPSPPPPQLCKECGRIVDATCLCVSLGVGVGGGVGVDVV